MANFNPGPASAVTPQTFAPMLNVTIGGVYNLTLTPAAIAANSTGAVVISATGLGLLPNDFVRVSFQGAQTVGIVLGDSWVSGADQLTVQFANVTAAAATPVSGNYDVLVLRPDAGIGQLNPAIQP